MNILKRANWIAGAALSLCAAQSVTAAEFLVRGGAHYFNTDGDVAGIEVDDSVTVTAMLTYLINDNWGVELLAGLPIQYDFELTTNGNEVGDVKSLPPALSAIYRIQPEATIRPYVGAGAFYSFFFDEDTNIPPLAGEIEVENDAGFLLIAGADIMVTNTWFLNVDVRWFQKEPDVRIGNTDFGELDISPLAVGVMVGREFSW